MDLRRTRPRNQMIVWVILGFFTAIIVVGGILVSLSPDWFVRLETEIGQWALSVTEDSWLQTFWAVITTALGPWPLRTVVLAIAGIALYRNESMIASWIVVSVIAQLALTTIAKTVFGRERPSNALVESSGYAFPSGHAAAAAMAGTVLILLTLVIMRRGRWLRRVLLALWFTLAVLVGASRVFLGVHFPSDVVVGLALGSLSAFVPWLIFTNKSQIVAVIPAALGGHRTVAVIYNPIKVGDVNDFKERVQEVSESYGYGHPIWFETTIEDPGIGQTQRALSANPQLIIVAGGDGTVRMVCGETISTGIPVGVLPMGTGNLLARNLGLSLNLTEALEIAFTGDARLIDIVKYRAQTTEGEKESFFLVMAGLGMDAAIMSGVRDDLKKSVGFFAYFVSGAKALRYPLTKVTIQVDDHKPKTYKARTVVIGNVGELPAGISLIPDAEIDDGILDVIVLAPRRFLGWLLIAWRVMIRHKETNDRLQRLSGKEITITTEKPTPMQLDGDPGGEGTSIQTKVLPKALLVRVPK